MLTIEIEDFFKNMLFSLAIFVAFSIVAWQQLNDDEVNQFFKMRYQTLAMFWFKSRK